MTPPHARCLLLAVAAWLGGVSCSLPIEEADQQRAAIVNGMPSEETAVVAIGFERPSCDDTLAAHCSGSLIRSDLVLTAAHCVDRIGDRYEVFIGADTAGDGASYAVHSVSLHPDFDDADNRHDIALLLLERPSDVPVLTLADAAPTVDEVGKDVYLAGFGMSAARADDAGVRRGGIGKIRSVTADGNAFETEPGPGMSCVADSGGPALSLEDRAILGITSAGDPECNRWGRSLAVANYRESFINPLKSQLQSPNEPRCPEPQPEPEPEANCSLQPGQPQPPWHWILLASLLLRRRWRNRQPSIICMDGCGSCRMGVYTAE